MYGSDRRRFPRARASWPAIVESPDGRAVSGEVMDVSLSGMKVKTDCDAPVGSAITLRVTLPSEAGRVEVVATVVRRDEEGIGVAFLKLSEVDASRVAPFVSSAEIRRRSPRVQVNLPVRIEGGSAGTAYGHTVDISASGSRLVLDRIMVPGDMVVLELPGADRGTPLRLPAVIWEAYSGGAVLVFANLAQPEFTRLRDYVNYFRQQGAQPTSV
ncbi:MAG TPA: PilZ domain-containing protein [Methylomirabilota bacterium]|nr:PilZ domain-containing protein [Methylomirabilota bacterium]